MIAVEDKKSNLPKLKDRKELKESYALVYLSGSVYDKLKQNQVDFNKLFMEEDSEEEYVFGLLDGDVLNYSDFTEIRLFNQGRRGEIHDAKFDRWVEYHKRRGDVCCSSMNDYKEILRLGFPFVKTSLFAVLPGDVKIKKEIMDKELIDRVFSYYNALFKESEDDKNDIRDQLKLHHKTTYSLALHGRVLVVVCHIPTWYYLLPFSDPYGVDPKYPSLFKSIYHLGHTEEHIEQTEDGSSFLSPGLSQEPNYIYFLMNLCRALHELLGMKYIETDVFQALVHHTLNTNQTVYEQIQLD